LIFAEGNDGRLFSEEVSHDSGTLFTTARGEKRKEKIIYSPIPAWRGIIPGNSRRCKSESLVGDAPARGESDVGLNHYLQYGPTSLLPKWGLIPAIGGQGRGGITPSVPWKFLLNGSSLSAFAEVVSGDA
jgi:hypothetical protein